MSWSTGLQTRAIVPPLLLLIFALTSCSAGDASTEAPAAVGDSAAGASPEVQQAEHVLKVTSVHAATGMTLLEGPTFGPDGELYLVDVTAPPGQPKVLRVDLKEETVAATYTDEGSALTSAQFSPRDGRLYVTDFVEGTIRSMKEDGTDVQAFFEGPVDGRQMQPDDISFDAGGNLFITDAAGARDPYWETTGRIIRIDATSGDATVLADDLPSPNGIGFSPDDSSLWISLNTGNRIDHLTLSEDGTEVATAFPAIHASVGQAQLDSIAVDSDGNLYVGLHNRPEILVYDTAGRMISTISVPAGDRDGLSSATNVAIKPGSTEAYATISGSNGGHLYRFTALAEGIRQSNGG